MSCAELVGVSGDAGTGAALVFDRGELDCDWSVDLIGSAIVKGMIQKKQDPEPITVKRV